MKRSLFFFGLFCVGLVLGKVEQLPAFLTALNLTMPVVLALLFFIGVSVGSDSRTIQNIRGFHLGYMLFPLFIAAGSLIGAGIFSLLLPNISFIEGLAVGAGMGYYSLSSILITEIYSSSLGVVALLSNLLREVSSILLIPLVYKWIGKWGSISMAGATSMDTALPSIHKAAGNDYVLISIISGIVLTVLVPILIPLILG